jgi:single-stranded-DNA-specific exonuclease
MDWIELDDVADDLVDLAAGGIVADMVDLGVDSLENRYICSKGFNNQVNPAIKKINGSYEFNSQAVSFGIAPLVNASNRLNENEKALQLFLSDNPKEISALVNDLKACKEYQNYEVANLMPQLEEQAQAQLDRKVMFFFVDVVGELAGLLGNKLLEKYQRPVIVLKSKMKIDEETGEVLELKYTGSCRAVGVPNFKQYVDNTGLAGSGGHELAFGLWLDGDVLEDFQDALEDALKDVEFVQETTVDIQLDASQITKDLIQQIKMLDRISGQGWPKITVLVSGINDYEVASMSGGKHLKLLIEGNLIFIKWNYSGDWDLQGELSAIGTLDSGFFGRTFYKQLIMNDFETIQN